MRVFPDWLGGLSESDEKGKFMMINLWLFFSIMLNKVLESSKSNIWSADGYKNWSKATRNKKKPKWQGLIQKEKVDIDVEKSAQISTVVKIL